MQSGLILGYDPGGNDAHGVAELQVHDGKVARLATRTLRTTEDVVAFLEGLSSLAALGVDTLTCWSTGPSGWRPADRWLRHRYPEVRNSVVSPNGLFGSMGLNGMAVLVAARKKFSDILITETHPKVLYWQIARARYDYPGSREAMHRVLAARLGIAVAPATEHEWDAAVSALAALESSGGRWPRDLHRMETEAHERLIEPCGTTHYSWPE
jgi:hypothetical protein